MSIRSVAVYSRDEQLEASQEEDSNFVVMAIGTVDRKAGVEQRIPCNTFGKAIATARDLHKSGSLIEGVSGVSEELLEKFL